LWFITLRAESIRISADLGVDVPGWNIHSVTALQKENSMGVGSNCQAISIDLRVNNRPFGTVQIRHEGTEITDDFDVLIDDSFCGILTLQEHFSLELYLGCSWQRVTLAELKDSLARSSEFPRPVDMPNSSEIAELRMLDHFYGDRQGAAAPHQQLTQLQVYDRCRRRVTSVLQDAGISTVPCGNVFVVPDRERARAVLLHAGFQNSAISAGALLEPFSSSTLYLIERPKRG
jgi:hypothetical protein